MKKVLNCFPKQMAPAVKSDLNDIQHAASRKETKAVLDLFSEKHAIKYSKGVACLNVTSRKVVWLFLKQLWLEFVPVLHGLQGRLAAQC